MAEECAHLAAALDDLVDGRLSPKRASRVQEHLRGCSACAAAVADLRALREQLARVEAAHPLPAGFETRLARRLAVARPERHVRPWWVAGPVLGAALGGFLGAVLLVQPGPPRAVTGTSAPRAPASGPLMYAAASINAPSPTVTQGATVTSDQVAGLTRATPLVPDAEAITLVANSPETALVGLSRLAASDGGQALATPAAIPSAPTGRQVAATLQADLPPSRLAGFAQQAAQYGTVIAQVSAPASTPPPTVHVLLTVLTPSAPPASAATTVTVRGWRARLLRAVGADWAFVAGGAVAAVLVALLLNRVRQGRAS